ncbi:potassium transporter Kup [Massilia sp. Root335]|uniref:potassium transporter Kup n=1 Tax=Massilia sp. Root335 TaxID=1736517 RepID=UPI000700E3D1|nr:potassium transporter Kup [Massilia sp. Root335]KQV45126.1 potassium transporter Kup [Massilia sp. Root335]
MDNAANTPQEKTGRLALITLGALGVVYGDIGTSPLYTMKTIFSKEFGLMLDTPNLLGAVSLIFWGLVLIVSLKYVTLILRADNHGEGGIMALMALASASVKDGSRRYYGLLLIGLLGAALFYGDSVITPAISVLSAIEGLEVATPALKPYVVPLTIVVLVVLYLVQHKGTGSIGKWFGPIMLLWFFALAAMGVINILKAPGVLAAVNPYHALTFMVRNKTLAFIALGAVVLAFTGAEALYADMGHFGKRPIRMAWFGIVAPALALNYLGQGALLMTHPDAIANPFFQQLGAWSVYPLVVLSTVATVIASQATISGTFSMTHEAISLGALPRMKVEHTSEDEVGQIYIPLMNWMQLIAVILAVVGFGSSDALGAAYGIAVTGTMLITTILTFFVIRYCWKYNLALSLAATAFFFVIDVTLFAANTLKFLQGGWFPLVVGAVILTVMMTWEIGSRRVSRNLEQDAVPLDAFLESLFIEPPPRVAGTAVYFRRVGEGVPHAMLHNLVHNKVAHERILFVTVHPENVPCIGDGERARVEALGHNCFQVNLYYGFKDGRDIPHALSLCADQGLSFDVMETSFFIARQTVVPTPKRGGLPHWLEGLYALLYRNARSAADYYRVPANRVIELGAQIAI